MTGLKHDEAYELEIGEEENKERDPVSEKVLNDTDLWIGLLILLILNN